MNLYRFLMAMDVRTPNASPLKEAPEEHRARVLREADAITKAKAELDTGLGIDDDELEAWLDHLDRDENTPVPSGPTRPASC